MMIRIDPMELVETSRVLDGAASEAVDIGTQLAACVRCPMPPALRVSVDHLVAAADAVLDSVAVRLHAEAVDLARRAVIAANDSLAAATGVAVGAGSAGAFAAGPMVIGGNSSQSFTILNADGTPAGPMPNIAVIGGHSSPGFTILNADGTPAGPMPNGTAVVGRPTFEGVEGAMIGMTEMRQVTHDEMRATINNVVRSNVGGYAFSVAMDAQTAISRSDIRPALPSRSDMEYEKQRRLSLPEYYSRVPGAAP